jgi:hypothetical protein
MISSSPQYATDPTVDWLPGTTRVGVGWLDSMGEPGQSTGRPLLRSGGPFPRHDVPRAARLVTGRGRAPFPVRARWRQPRVAGQDQRRLADLRDGRSRRVEGGAVSNSGMYLGLEKAAGTEVLRPGLGAPHPLMMNTTFFNPPTLMLRWGVREVPKGPYTFSFYAPAEEPPRPGPPLRVDTERRGGDPPSPGRQRALAGRERGRSDPDRVLDQQRRSRPDPVETAVPPPGFRGWTTAGSPTRAASPGPSRSGSRG